MDIQEARRLLDQEIDTLRSLGYSALKETIGAVQSHDVTGSSGTEYTVEIDVAWESEPEANITVILGIDGAVPNSLVGACALCAGFNIAPDGEVVRL